MKYFGVKIDEDLNWKDQTHDNKVKQSKYTTLKLQIVLVLMLWKQFTLQSLIHIYG